MAVDILAAVYEFVKAYAYNPEDADSKQLTADQIIRAGLNDAPVVSTSTELCIIAHVSTIRHGTNHYQYEYDQSQESYKERASEMLEHIISIDFLSAEPMQKQEITAERAQIIELLARSPTAVKFFAKYGLSSLFAENVTNVTGWDETKNYTARYNVKLHIGQRFNVAADTDFFTSVNVRSVKAHTSETRETAPGWMLTENVDNNHD